MKVVPFTVFRKDNRRRRIRDRRLYVHAAVVVVLVCTIAAVLYIERAPIKRSLANAAAFVFDNPYFSVREIQVRGGGKVGGSEIVAMAGLRHGMNLWNVDAASIEQKLRRHPSVRRVLVRREFPRRVVIDVEERQPRAVVALGKLYYIDSDGFVFKEVGEGEKADFPLLTLITPGMLLPLALPVSIDPTGSPSLSLQFGFTPSIVGAESASYTVLTSAGSLNISLTGTAAPRSLAVGTTWRVS